MDDTRTIVLLDRRPTLGDALIIFVVAEVIGLDYGSLSTMDLAYGYGSPRPSITYLAVATIHLFLVRRIKPDVIGLRTPVSLVRLLCWLLLGTAYGCAFVLIGVRFGCPPVPTKEPFETILAIESNALLLSPIGEELCYRAVLFTAFEAKLGSWVAILFVVLIDGLAHLPYMLRARTFIFHVCVRIVFTLFCLSALYWRKRDLALNIVAHSGINAGIALAGRLV